jgi:hypothetical protein
VTNVMSADTSSGLVTTVFTHDAKRHGFDDGDYVVRAPALSCRSCLPQADPLARSRAQWVVVKRWKGCLTFCAGTRPCCGLMWLCVSACLRCAPPPRPRPPPGVPRGGGRSVPEHVRPREDQELQDVHL